MDFIIKAGFAGVAIFFGAMGLALNRTWDKALTQTLVGGGLAVAGLAVFGVIGMVGLLIYARQKDNGRPVVMPPAQGADPQDLARAIQILQRGSTLPMLPALPASVVDATRGFRGEWEQSDDQRRSEAGRG